MALIPNERVNNKEKFTESIKEDVIQFGRALDKETAEAVLMGIPAELLFDELIRRLDKATNRYDAISSVVGGTTQVSPELRKNMVTFRESFRILFKTVIDLQRKIGGVTA